MHRCFIFLMLAPWMVSAQKFSAADLGQLKNYCTGVFSNEAQVKAGATPTLATLQVHSIWPKRKDGVWLFTEQSDMALSYQVWHFYLQDDTTAVMQVFDFKEKEKGAQLSKNSKQDTSLAISNLFTNRGCERYLKKNKAGYTGTSAGKDCMADRPGVEYITSGFVLTRTTIGIEKHSFDKDDKQLEEQVYQFARQLKSSK